MSNNEAIIFRVSGPVVQASNAAGIKVREQVLVGKENLIGEVIECEDDKITIQVYEETYGLRPGDTVRGTGESITAFLGPGLIGSIYDGLQRPLYILQEKCGSVIKRGVVAKPLNEEKKWPFVPVMKAGDSVSANDILGTVQETQVIKHRIIVPNGTEGKITYIAPQGEYSIMETICKVATPSGEKALTMAQRWPVRTKRPYHRKLLPNIPMITGQRVLDFLFPISRGGTSAIPGGFGTGKTVTQHQLAKWSDADIIVYIGCGERGNEMTQVLTEFPELFDPRNKRPLMERTVLIANTSNMPVTARESSIYTGMTIAEYFRDMGYHTAIMADSTSRWAEALRELSGRLEEMPAEEGYPAYLPTRLAQFYERAGYVEINPDDPKTGKKRRDGSVTVVGAVSPPGGDFSEPVTMNTKRFIRSFWALDKNLASARHFPAINYLESYSEYSEMVSDWWKKNHELDYLDMRTKAIMLLQEDDRLQRIAKLVGKDALPDNERLVMETARMIKEGFLQQAAFDEIDTFCSPEKQLLMMDLILHFHEKAKEILHSGCPVLKIYELGSIEEMLRMKYKVPNDDLSLLKAIRSRMDEELDRLAKEYQ